MTDSNRALSAVTARLLEASCIFAAWALALAIVSMAVLALTGRSLPLVSWLGFAAVVLLGLPERYLAFRLRFDAGLFAELAQERIASLVLLDQALHHLNVRKPLDGGNDDVGDDDVGDGPRALQCRVAGTRKLLQRHGAVVICQSVLFLLALLTQDLR